MTQEAGGVPPEPPGPGNREWVEAWQEAVRVSPLALGLPSAEFIELSPRAAELLGTSDDAIGLDYRAIVQPRKQVERTLRLLDAGALDSMQARRRLRQVDGSFVEVLMYARAIRSSAGADLGLWVAVDVPTSGGRAAVTSELADRLALVRPELRHAAVGTLDHRWRVAQLDTDAEELLGHRPAELVGSSIIDMTHPGDGADLLLAFARATSDVNASVRVRMRHRRRTWQPVDAVVTLLDSDSSSRFAFALATDEQPHAAPRGPVV